MKIKSIQLKGYRRFSDIKLDNLDPNLNLLIGVNGAGKSTILDATALLLSAFTARLSTTSSKGNRIAVNDIKRGGSSSSLSLTLDNDVVWTKKVSRKLDKDEESDFSKLNEFTKPIRAQLDSGEPICLPIIVHYGVKRSVSDIPLKFPKVDYLSPALAYKNWIDSKASYRDIFPWIRGEEDYENELIRENPDARVRSLVALREAMRNIFPEYTDMRVRRKPHLEVVLKKQGEELQLSQLSDGEKCYIALICDIVRRLTLANPDSDILSGDGVVLIDEVDLHLHPSWEQDIMPKLHATFPNLQFIVSAHSPLVASNFNGQIYAVDNGKVKMLPRLYGLDYSTILQDWMCTSPKNKEISTLIELYKAYEENDMYPQAQAVKGKLIEIFDGDENAEALKFL